MLDSAMAGCLECAKNPFLKLIDLKCLHASASIVGSMGVVDKGGGGYCIWEDDEKVDCLSSLKGRQEDPVYYHGDFFHFIWKVM